MYKISNPLFLYCETPLHAGSGSELGIIDLPIQRERHTTFPKVEASSLKGALRERAEQVLNISYDNHEGEESSDITKRMELCFGPESSSNQDLFAGALGFTDARLLLFPVKSMKGVFVWITCPQVIKRFIKDVNVAKIELPGINEGAFESLKDSHARIVSTDLCIGGDKIILEEYAFTAEKSEDLENLANWLISNLFSDSTFWMEKIGKSLVLVSDDDFRDFVNLSTEVITRTKIDNKTGTVQDGALFTEEYLPTDSVLYSMVLAGPTMLTPSKKAKLSLNETEVMGFFSDFISEKANNYFQLGANQTIGKGIIRTNLLK